MYMCRKCWLCDGDIVIAIFFRYVTIFFDG